MLRSSLHILVRSEFKLVLSEVTLFKSDECFSEVGAKKVDVSEFWISWSTTLFTLLLSSLSIDFYFE